MANVSVILSATITVTDTTLSPSPTIVARSLQNPTLAATTTFYDPFFQALAGGSAVSLPAATVFVVYVKNLSGATNLTVAFTPVGAGAASSLLLLPGGVFDYFLTAETGGGISAVTLTGGGATCSAEVLVAA
jgi:hypothetical protein